MKKNEFLEISVVRFQIQVLFLVVPWNSSQKMSNAETRQNIAL